MELKDYQITVLETFSRWYKELVLEKSQSLNNVSVLQNVNESILDTLRNYPENTWNSLSMSGGVAANAGDYVSRTDGVNRPIPHVCFKIPTGGGKTILAAAALERLNIQNGLVLWITPTRAIYEQTKVALWNKEHAYRQILERASGGRVKMLEKDDQFSASDIVNYFCVMLLMLPAANRQKYKEFLRMFRDSGRYSTFFPDSDDLLGDDELLFEYPDLERTSKHGPVKHSLFNVFKMLRPVVVLDEAHKAYGIKRQGANEEFVRSVNRLNPSLVVELSATPNKGISNLLVDVTGIELKNEEMIKLPVNVSTFTNIDWQITLIRSHEQLEALTHEAISFEHSEGRYIRPIAVVRVERTGKNQRESERVHAEDVREYLIQQLGVPAQAVRVKSAETDELGREDLLSKSSPVQWIITKAALMEGWDCPFAYLLVMLDNTTAQRAIIQLVGRVLRQPNAQRTRRKLLDQCYVYCWNTDVGKAVEYVKKGLEQEGMTDLGEDIVSESLDTKSVKVRRRNKFQQKNIFLPMVLHEDEEDWIELDYHRHILPGIDWSSIHAPELESVSAKSTEWHSATVDLGEAQVQNYSARNLYVNKTIKVSWFARRLSDVIPNPWQAARIVQETVVMLQEQGKSDEDIYDARSAIAYALREHVVDKVELQAEKEFLRKLRDRKIRFDLTTKKPNYQMMESYEIPVGRDDSQFQKGYGQPIQLSLFEPVFNKEFDSNLEREFARYLDEHRALKWWHRVAARQRGDYYLRGWNRYRIWPDFVAMKKEINGKPHMLVFETKGEHFRDNPDTQYKEQVLDALQNAFNCGSMTVQDGPAKGTFRLVFDKSDFHNVLPPL